MSPHPLLEEALRLVHEVVSVLRGRQHVSAEEAEELGSRARMKLIDQDSAVLRRFAGDSTLRTYLTTVIHRLLLDLRRERWGKWRPSAAALRLGPVGVRLEVLLLRDGRTLEEASAILSVSGEVTVSRESLAEMAETFPARMLRRNEGEEPLASLSVSAQVTESWVRDREQAARGAKIAQSLAQALVTLTAQDRLLLRLHYQDGFTVSEAARMLHLEQKPLYRRLERILADLRRLMEADGVEATEMADILGAANWEFPALLGSAVRSPDAAV